MKSVDGVRYQKGRIDCWDNIARANDTRKNWSGYYHARLQQVYKSIIPEGQRVIEIGCAQGDLLAAMKPSYGVGIDFSPEMVKRAEQKYPELHFMLADAHSLENLQEKFDIIILSDLVDDLWDVQEVFKQVLQLSTSRTRIILNFYSRLWDIPLKIAKFFKSANPVLEQNWLTVQDIAGLLHLSGYETISQWEEIMVPLQMPLITSFANRFLVKAWPFRGAALANFMVARPTMQSENMTKNPKVSVIVPARNEAGNISDIFKRTPKMGGGTELIFVEGNSKDNTYSEIEKGIAEHKDQPAKLLRQTGKGKGDAVRLGFSEASGDILMILDADLTVAPEDLPKFMEVLLSEKAEFVNGVRLVYPMERKAMRFMNLMGNKFFSMAFSWLLRQGIKDTLCGTKVLWREDYELIANNRKYFGDFDPFGDFDLLFGAAKLNMKIVDLPIRYHERTYGSTNIQRWKHGCILLRMVAFAAKKLKFI